MIKVELWILFRENRALGVNNHRSLSEYVLLFLRLGRGATGGFFIVLLFLQYRLAIGLTCSSGFYLQKILHWASTIIGAYLSTCCCSVNNHRSQSEYVLLFLRLGRGAAPRRYTTLQLLSELMMVLILVPWARS